MTDEHDRAAAHARLIANSFTLWLRMAAELHPDLLREALRDVFDLRCIEARTQRAIDLCAAGQKYGQDVRHLLTSIRDDLEQIEKRIDALNYELDRTQARKPDGQDTRTTAPGTSSIS